MDWSWPGRFLAATWFVVVVVADLATGDRVSLAPLYALSPLIACAVLSAPATAGFALAAIGAALLSGLWSGSWGTPQHAVRIVDVVVVSLAAVLIATVTARRERQHARVLAIAEVAQRAILPRLPARAGQVSVAARYLSAATDAVVGGDLYDCYYSRAHVRFVVGDVRGKGVAAVEQAARVIRAFRQSAAIEPDLSTVAREMSGYLAPFFDDEEFVTALLVDATDPYSLDLVSCGHPPPLLLVRGAQPDRAQLVEAPACVPLGLGQTYESVRIPWEPGTRLLMYTDGVSEARDRKGRFLEPLDLSGAVGGGTVEAALDEVLASVRAHVPRGQLGDDLAVVLLENVAEPRAAGSTPQSTTQSFGPDPVRDTSEAPVAGQ